MQGRDAETEEAQRKFKITSRKVTTGAQEQLPLIHMGDADDQQGLHAVRDSCRWMSACPMAGFMKVKKVWWTVERLTAVHQTACVQR